MKAPTKNSLLFSLAFSIGAAFIAAPAHAAEAADQPWYSQHRSPTVDRLKVRWRFELGYRGSFVTDAGYNPFSTQDYFPQLSIAASRTVYAHGRISFAPGFAWDYGRSSATSRGAAASLDVHRLVIPLEGRVHFAAWGYAFVRAAPGLAFEEAQVDDASSPAPLTKSRWLFATDVSAGYAYPIWSRSDVSELAPRIWVQADAGYGWIVAQRLNLAPDLPPGDPRIASGTDLGTLTMRGTFLRFAAAVSF